MNKKLSIEWSVLIILVFVISALLVTLWSAKALEELESQLFSIEWVNNSLLGGAVNFQGLAKNDWLKRPKPAPIESRGIYLTSWTASSARFEELLAIIQRTELNTMVIDVKDATGKVFFDARVPLTDQIGAKEIRLKNLSSLLDRLHQNKVYAIARIVVFQDPILARAKPELALKNKNTGGIWLNYRGQAWVDPASEEAWKYNIDIAREAVRFGFDEVNFDYIRFPSDGQLNLIEYPVWDGQTAKYKVMRSFFEYVHEELKDLPAYHSVDLFGLAVWDENYDLNIGQRLVDTLGNFDYICPMVYPSHYYDGFEGYANPADHPYEIIYMSLMKAKEQMAKASEELGSKLRPWLQAFDMGAVYDAAMIGKEKQAVYDTDAYGWLLWNARNVYNEAALE
jgi:hypothetical protein